MVITQVPPELIVKVPEEEAIDAPSITIGTTPGMEGFSETVVSPVEPGALNYSFPPEFIESLTALAQSGNAEAIKYLEAIKNQQKEVVTPHLEEVIPEEVVEIAESAEETKEGVDNIFQHAFERVTHFPQLIKDAIFDQAGTNIPETATPEERAQILTDRTNTLFALYLTTGTALDLIITDKRIATLIKGFTNLDGELNIVSLGKKLGIPDIIIKPVEQFTSGLDEKEIKKLSKMLDARVDDALSTIVEHIETHKIEGLASNAFNNNDPEMASALQKLLPSLVGLPESERSKILALVYFTNGSSKDMREALGKHYGKKPVKIPFIGNFITDIRDAKDMEKIWRSVKDVLRLEAKKENVPLTAVRDESRSIAYLAQFFNSLTINFPYINNLVNPATIELLLKVKPFGIVAEKTNSVTRFLFSAVKFMEKTRTFMDFLDRRR